MAKSKGDGKKHGTSSDKKAKAEVKVKAKTEKAKTRPEGDKLSQKTEATPAINAEKR